MAGGAAFAFLGVGIGFLGGSARSDSSWSSARWCCRSSSPAFAKETPARTEKPLRETWSYRWSRFVQKRPWPMAIGVSVLSCSCSASRSSGLRLGFGDESTFAEDTTTREAYELLAEGFGAGSNGPLLRGRRDWTSPESAPDAAQNLVATLNDAARALRAHSDRSHPRTSEAFQIYVVPEHWPQDEADLGPGARRCAPTVIPASGRVSELDVKVTGAGGGKHRLHLITSGPRLPVFFVAVLDAVVSAADDGVPLGARSRSRPSS